VAHDGGRGGFGPASSSAWCWDGTAAAWHYAGGAVRRAALPTKLASESRLLLGLRGACYGCAAAVFMLWMACACAACMCKHKDVEGRREQMAYGEEKETNLIRKCNRKDNWM